MQGEHLLCKQMMDKLSCRIDKEYQASHQICRALAVPMLILNLARPRIQEELQSRIWPVLRCLAEGGCQLKGGGFSQLISAGRAGYGRDVMESGVSLSVTNTF